MAINDKFILTIDLGTSGPKVALFSTDGEVIDYEFEKTQVYLLPDGGAEQSPDEWWQAIKKATARLLKKVNIPIRDITTISCTSQWSGTVAVDSNGKALMNAIIWMDSRGSKQIKDIAAGMINFEGYGIWKIQKWLRLTGGIPGHSGKDPLAHILYIKDQLPEIYSKTFKFLEPKDYINFRLTGEYAASFDSIALHWVTDNRDISNITYNKDLIRMSSMDREKLPELKQALDMLGPLKPEIAEELGLPKGTDVIMGTPDCQSAAIGSGAVKDFEGHLYIGTSSWLTCHVPYKKTDIVNNMASLPSAIPDKYYIANEQETAGGCLNYLRDNILFHNDAAGAKESPADFYQMLDRIAEKVPAGSGKVIFTPWLYGERTPVEDSTIRGGFYNLSLNTTRSDLIRAVFEGVAFNAKWLLQGVEKFIKRKFESLNAIGGGANSDIWCQIHADILNRPIRQIEDPILANSRGAALLASVAMGFITFNSISETIKVSKEFTPNPENQTLYMALFKEFLNIYKANHRMYARLNG